MEYRKDGKSKTQASNKRFVLNNVGVSRKDNVNNYIIGEEVGKEPYLELI